MYVAIVCLYDQSYKPVWSVSFSSWILFINELQGFLVYWFTVFWFFSVMFSCVHHTDQCGILCSGYFVYHHFIIIAILSIRHSRHHFVFVVPDGFFYVYLHGDLSFVTVCCMCNFYVLTSV
jgi:hypothetical protein